MKPTDVSQVKKAEMKYPLVMTGGILEIDQKRQPCSVCRDSVAYIIAVMQRCMPGIPKKLLTKYNA